MFRVLECLTTKHDYRLVLLAALICAVTTFVSFRLFARAIDARGAADHPHRGPAWIGLTGLTTGTGIWSTHVVVALGYDVGFPAVYEPFLMLVSLGIGIVGATAGFWLAAGGGLAAMIAGGAALGAGVAAMHYTAMAATILPGTLEWEMVLVVASIAFGVVLATAALVAHHRWEGAWGIWMAPGLLTLAVCLLHFTGTSAATVVLDPTFVLPTSLTNNSAMAIAVAATTMLVMLAAIAAALVDTYTARPVEEELRRQHLRFDAALSNMSHGLSMVDRERRLVVCNSRWAEIYGVPPELAKPGIGIGEVLQFFIDHKTFASTETDPQRLLTTQIEPSSRSFELANGRRILVSRQPTADGGWIAIHEDVTERQALSALLEQQNDLLKVRETELKKQNVNLDIALANMLQGLAMFDADERLVLANAPYAEIYGFSPEQMRPGMTLREVIEARFARGQYSGRTIDDVMATMRERVASRSASQFTTSPFEGCVLSVSVQPRPDGGWVVTLHDITEREALHARLQQQNELLQKHDAEVNLQNEKLDAALANMSQGIAMFDAEQRVIIANDRYAELYGLAPESVKPGTRLRGILEARIAAGVYGDIDAEKFLEAGTGGFHDTVSEIIRLNDGRFISVLRQPMPNGGLVSTHEDITERQQLNAQLAQQNERLLVQEQQLRSQNVQFDAALENMVQGLAMFGPDRRLVISNKRYAEIYGLTAEQVKPGAPLHDVFSERVAEGEFAGQSVDDMLSLSDPVDGRKAAHYISHLSDGRHIAISAQVMADGGIVTTHHDITEQRRSEAKIAHMALHDTLTGLPNRVLMNERLVDAMRRIKRGEIVATHLLDLDHFKTVNDTLGHPAGDKLLKMVADRLRALVRETDTIARMGGDEFAIVQVGIAQPGDATSLSHRVIEAVSAPYQIDGHQVVIGTSVGIAVGPSDGKDPDQLIRNADLALYRAKGDGRGTYRFFEPAMDAAMQARRSLEDDLRKALPNGEFELCYQPVVTLATDRVSGMEALIRWRHPDKGTVPPGMFIPLAEEIGFIIPLGEWVVREACFAAAKWPGELTVAVNLSPAQFRSPGLVQVVVGALSASGLAAERLELEITETILLQDSEATLSTLYQLRALGVRIAMDDFGTGYSSLSYLQSFPFDRIKIDRSFVKDIADGVGSVNIVRAVAAMAKGLGMTTTAEGVETPEQLRTVRAEGCTEMQGYVFSKPLPASEVAQFLEERRVVEGFGNDTRGAESARGAA